MAFEKFAPQLLALTGLIAVAACVPSLAPGETSTAAAGDALETRKQAEKLYLPASSSQSALNANRIECDKLGGDYGRQGLAGGYMCVLSYSDAGKICSRAGDCIGDCRITGGDFSGPTGYCQPNTIPFGCYAKIDENGKIGPAICVD